MGKKIVRFAIFLGAVVTLALTLHLIVHGFGSSGLLEVIKKMHGG